MMSYVQKLAHKSPYVKLKIIGKSQQGRDIPALYFSKEKKFADGKTSKSQRFGFKVKFMVMNRQAVNPYSPLRRV
ncbi:hypothetical protein AAAC51_26960 [Priestia megaterium]